MGKHLRFAVAALCLALTGCGSPPRDLLRERLQALKSPDPGVRREAARGLALSGKRGELAAQATIVTPTLMGVVHDEDRPTRSWAAVALAHVGLKTPAAGPARALAGPVLQEAAGDENPEVRAEAGEALRKVEQASPPKPGPPADPGKGEPKGKPGEKPEGPDGAGGKPGPSRQGKEG